MKIAIYDGKKLLERYNGASHTFTVDADYYEKLKEDARELEKYKREKEDNLYKYFNDGYAVEFEINDLGGKRLKEEYKKLNEIEGLELIKRVISICLEELYDGEEK